MRIIPTLPVVPSGGFTRASTGSYFDRAGALQTAAVDTPRFDHDPVTHAAEGLLLEAAATNVLLNSAALSTQGCAVTAQPYVLSFYGTGSITLSGAASGVLVGTGAFPARVQLAFTATVGTLTLTVAGSALMAQLEASSTAQASSYIATTGAPATRAADVLTASYLTNVAVPTTTGSNPDPALAHNPATAYTVGNQVYLLSTRRRYQSRTAHTNKDPALALPNAPSADWADIGALNAYSAIDLYRNAPTCNAESVVLVFKLGRRSNSVGMAGVLGSTARVKVFEGTQLTFASASAMTYRETLTWYEYVHGEFKFRSKFARFNLPPITAGIVQVIVDRPGLEAMLGGTGLGMSEFVGKTLSQAEVDSLNFSRINRDAFGTADLVPSRSIPKFSVVVHVEKTRLGRVLRLRDELNAVPAFYYGLDDLSDPNAEALALLGIYRTFKPVLANNSASFQLDAEEI